jgi:hypothetical protein
MRRHHLAGAAGVIDEAELVAQCSTVNRRSQDVLKKANVLMQINNIKNKYDTQLTMKYGLTISSSLKNVEYWPTMVPIF